MADLALELIVHDPRVVRPAAVALQLGDPILERELGRDDLVELGPRLAERIVRRRELLLQPRRLRLEGVGALL